MLLNASSVLRMRMINAHLSASKMQLAATFNSAYSDEIVSLLLSHYTAMNFIFVIVAAETVHTIVCIFATTASNDLREKLLEACVVESTCCKTAQVYDH
jgi:hypothetical protein